MHLPDGFLSNSVSCPLIGVALALICIAFHRLRREFFIRAEIFVALSPSGVLNKNTEVVSAQSSDKIKRMAVVAGFIFAAQMINFPIASGTSGHLLGGVLAAVLLGPWAGFIVISTVLLIQSLLYADGGLIALGANIFNMGGVGAILGYYIYQGLAVIIKRRLLAISLAAWLSVVLAAIFTSIELAFSSTIPFGQVFPAMVKVHALIGIGEAAVTVLVWRLYSPLESGENSILS